MGLLLYDVVVTTNSWGSKLRWSPTTHRISIASSDKRKVNVYFSADDNATPFLEDHSRVQLLGLLRPVHETALKKYHCLRIRSPS